MPHPVPEQSLPNTHLLMNLSEQGRERAPVTVEAKSLRRNARFHARDNDALQIRNYRLRCCPKPGPGATVGISKHHASILEAHRDRCPPLREVIVGAKTRCQLVDATPEPPLVYAERVGFTHVHIVDPDAVVPSQ